MLTFENVFQEVVTLEEQTKLEELRRQLVRKHSELEQSIQCTVDRLDAISQQVRTRVGLTAGELVECTATTVGSSNGRDAALAVAWLKMHVLDQTTPACSEHTRHQEYLVKVKRLLCAVSAESKWLSQAALAAKVMAHVTSPTQKKLLNLCYDWLRTFLPHILAKVNRVSFGLLSSKDCAAALEADAMVPQSRLKLAVPFVGKDVPSRSSEFAHPDVILGLTILGYRYSGMRFEDFSDLIDALSAEFSQEIGPARERPSSVRHEAWVLAAGGRIRGIKTKDKGLPKQRSSASLRNGSASATSEMGSDPVRKQASSESLLLSKTPSVSKKEGADQAGDAVDQDSVPLPHHTDEQINLKVESSFTNPVVQLKIKKSTRLCKLFEAYCVKQDLHTEEVTFYYKGERLMQDDTAEKMKMEEDFVIHAKLESAQAIEVVQLKFLQKSNAEQMQKLWKLWHKEPLAIHYYLSKFVFPAHMRSQKTKVSASGQALGGDMLVGRRVGFSGTPSDLLPKELGKCDYETGDDGKMLKTVLDQEIVSYELLPNDWTVQKVLAHIASAESPRYHALIDTGALITGYSNSEVAAFLLKQGLSWCEGVVFLDENDEKQVLVRATGRAVPADQCGVPLEKRFAFYDQVSRVVRLRLRLRLEPKVECCKVETNARLRHSCGGLGLIRFAPVCVLDGGVTCGYVPRFTRPAWISSTW